MKNLSICNDCGSTSAMRSHFGRHIQTTHVWTDHKMPAVTVSSLFTTEQDEGLTTKVVVRRMTAPLPFLLRSRSHCCSPCLPPPCSLLCKTRSLLSRPLTCGLCCYCQVCLEHYRRNYCRLCYHDAVVRLSPLELVHGRDVASSLAWEPAIYDSYVLPCWLPRPP